MKTVVCATQFKKVKKQESSYFRVESTVKGDLGGFGTVEQLGNDHRVGIRRHNEEVTTNQRILVKN